MVRTEKFGVDARDPDGDDEGKVDLEDEGEEEGDDEDEEGLVGSDVLPPASCDGVPSMYAHTNGSHNGTCIKQNKTYSEIYNQRS